MISDIYELEDIVISLMGNITDDLVNTDRMDEIANQTLRELAWELPVDDDFQEYWMIERTKRHTLYALIFEAAKKFRFKQIFLQQRFENYFKLLEKMDEDFLSALETTPELFDVASSTAIAVYLTNGFSYDALGRDCSYQEDWNN